MPTVVATTASRAGSGIVVAPAEAGAQGAELSMPGVVEPDGYRQVDITTLLGGTVIDMLVVPGALVERGQVVARLRSPELADEFQRWRTAVADREVVASRLTRVTRLAAIGAASRQDLEQVQADDVRAATEVDARRSRLLRLGVDETRLQATPGADGLPDTFDVRATARGVVVDRSLNPGTNIDAGERVVTLAETTAVWVIASVYMPDMARVRVGQIAQVTTDGFPGRVWSGRVTYIDPALSAESRTVRVRVEVSSPDAALRFGMLTTVTVRQPGATTGVTVPRSAVQWIGAAPVVYVQTSTGTYDARTVTVRDEGGTRLTVLSGLNVGEPVVVEGAFALRAEDARLGATVATAGATASTAPPAAAAQPDGVAIERVVEITAAGLVPPRVTVPAGTPVDLVFIRKVDQTCGTEVSIPDLDIRRDLPFGERVVIRIPAREPGELAFSCGMDMLKGVLVVTR
jgi:RND family efflux transporter MFP subunit